MRIISQDNSIDLPYERFVISVNMQNQGEIIAWTGNHISDDECIVMAIYSSREKAQKAMEMLQTAYTGRFVTNADVSDDFNEQLKKLMKGGFGTVIVKDTNDSRVEFDNLNGYFRFPRDEDVEVLQ